MEVWTVLLSEAGGGWVMGVFTSRDDAIAKLREYEANQGGSELGEPIYDDGGAMCTIPMINSKSDARFIIASYVIGVIDL